MLHFACKIQDLNSLQKFIFTICSLEETLQSTQDAKAFFSCTTCDSHFIPIPASGLERYQYPHLGLNDTNTRIWAWTIPIPASGLGRYQYPHLGWDDTNTETCILAYYMKKFKVEKKGSKGAYRRNTFAHAKAFKLHHM